MDCKIFISRRGDSTIAHLMIERNSAEDSDDDSDSEDFINQILHLTYDLGDDTEEDRRLKSVLRTVGSAATVLSDGAMLIAGRPDMFRGPIQVQGVDSIYLGI